MDKCLIRDKNRILRRKLNQKEASRIIVSKILNSDFFIKSKNILLFYPMKYEINLLGLMNDKNKNFFLPKVFKDELLICPYGDNLKESNFKVMEPETEPIEDISIIDTAFIPCLAADKELNRIGYGKGFYDRLLSRENFHAKKIAVINKELLADKIDVNKNDRKVDLIITD